MFNLISIAHAADKGLVTCGGLNCNVCEVLKTASQLFNWLLSISGAVAIVFLVIGGFVYLGAQGNRDKMRRAKDLVVKALVGFGIILLAWLVVQSFLKVFGAKGESWWSIQCEVPVTVSSFMPVERPAQLLKAVDKGGNLSAVLPANTTETELLEMLKNLPEGATLTLKKDAGKTAETLVTFKKENGEIKIIQAPKDTGSFAPSLINRAKAADQTQEALGTLYQSYGFNTGIYGLIQYLVQLIQQNQQIIAMLQTNLNQTQSINMCVNSFGSWYRFNNTCEFEKGKCSYNSTTGCSLITSSNTVDGCKCPEGYCLESSGQCVSTNNNTNTNTNTNSNGNSNTNGNENVNTNANTNTNSNDHATCLDSGGTWVEGPGANCNWFHRFANWFHRFYPNCTGSQTDQRCACPDGSTAVPTSQGGDGACHSASDQQTCQASGGNWRCEQTACMYSGRPADAGPCPMHCSCSCPLGQVFFSKLLGGDGQCHTKDDLKNKCTGTSGQWITDYGTLQGVLNGSNLSSDIVSNSCSTGKALIHTPEMCSYNADGSGGSCASLADLAGCKCSSGQCVNSSGQCTSSSDGDESQACTGSGGTWKNMSCSIPQELCGGQVIVANCIGAYKNRCVCPSGTCLDKSGGLGKCVSNTNTNTNSNSNTNTNANTNANTNTNSSGKQGRCESSGGSWINFGRCECGKKYCNNYDHRSSFIACNCTNGTDSGVKNYGCQCPSGQCIDANGRCRGIIPPTDPIGQKNCEDSGGKMSYTCRISYNELSDSAKQTIGLKGTLDDYLGCWTDSSGTCYIKGDSTNYNKCLALGGKAISNCVCPAGTYSNPIVSDNDNNKKCFPAGVENNCTTSGGQWLHTFAGNGSDTSGNLSCADKSKVIYSPVPDPNNRNKAFSGCVGYNDNGGDNIFSSLFKSASACISPNYYCKCPSSQCVDRDTGKCGLGDDPTRLKCESTGGSWGLPDCNILQTVCNGGVRRPCIEGNNVETCTCPRGKCLDLNNLRCLPDTPAYYQGF